MHPLIIATFKEFPGVKAMLSQVNLIDESGNEQIEPQFWGDHFLKWLDLSQSQVAALLAVTPQAVSKGIKEDGIEFFEKEKAQRLYERLLFCGGDRYSLSAARLKDAAQKFKWGNLEAPYQEVDTVNKVSPAELYEDADELWVVSDAPEKVVDWDTLTNILFSEPVGGRSSQFGDRHKVIVFFLSTIEGAERLSEAFEREMLKPAINDYRVQSDKALHINAYVFFVVTNLTPYAQDFLITNPGSQCMGVFASNKSPKVSYWNSGSYVRADFNAKGFVKIVHHNKLGMTAIKANFFPKGDKLTTDDLDLGKSFMDGFIAIRGLTAEEDLSKDGDNMAGGIFRSVVGRAENVSSFNKLAKFCPLFLLAYKRKPGDSVHISGRTATRIQAELDEQKELELERQRELELERQRELELEQHKDKPSMEDNSAARSGTFWSRK